jgi:hypothetical protein
VEPEAQAAAVVAQVEPELQAAQAGQAARAFYFYTIKET